MRFVPIGSAKIGTVIAKNIYDEKGRILLHSGMPLTESLINKLELNQVIGIHILDDYSRGEIKDIISPELRQVATKEIQAVFKSVRSDIEKSLAAIGKNGINFQKKIQLKVDKNYLDKLDDVIENMLNELTHNRDAMVGLVDIKNMKSFVYQHSIQVTVLSLLIGVAMHMNQKMLKELAIGAMLHDIGLSFLHKDLLVYKESFTMEQKEVYHSHCRLGHDFIRENTRLSAPCRMGILQHHEQNSGKGYPIGLEGNEIHLNARIIALANAYDKMTSGIGSVLVAPNEAIEFIMGNSGDGRMFDFEIASHFIRRIVPFPIGSFVLLSTGDKGVIISYNTGHPLRPVLKVIKKDKAFEDLKVMNLLDHDNLKVTITKAVYE